MAYTLEDYARLARKSRDSLKMGVVDVFRRESMIMDRLSFVDSKTLTLELMRTKALPSVAWRRIGGSFSASKGTIEPIAERLFDLGGKIDIDKLLVKSDTEGGVDQMALQTDMFVTAMAYQFNDSFVTGDPVTTPDGITGLFYRIKNYLPAAQEINLNGLDVSPDASGLTANLNTLADNIAKAIHRCDGHSAGMMIVNETLYQRLISLVRQLGLYSQSQDNYGRKIVRWGEGGPEIVDLGVKADQSTLIMADAELANGTALSGGTATSIYFLKLGPKYLQGMQLYPMDVQKIGLLESGEAFRTVVDWPIGIFMVNPRSVSRLSGIQAS